MPDSSQPNPTPRLSVIIPVYNGAATLPAVLAGLNRQTLDPACFEVVVADDCSTDGTAALLSEQAGQVRYRLRVLEQDRNRGASAARNLAARAALGDYLLFIDADCLPEEHLLEYHLKDQQDRPDGPAIIGRIIWSPEFSGSPMSEYFKSFYFPDQAKLPGLEETAPGRPEKAGVPFTYFVTSNASLPRRRFEELGGFDEDFRYLFDDTVLGYRLEQAGGRLLLDRRAVVYHHRPLLPAEAVARYRRQGQEAMHLLKKYPELTGLAADPGEILADRYHQEELYRLLTRYALGRGFAEGAGRYFEAEELDELLARPEFAANFATWRDRRLELYRAELRSLREDREKTQAYLAQLQAAYERERREKAGLAAELKKEQAYSAGLEKDRGYPPQGFNPRIPARRLARLFKRGQQASRNFITQVRARRKH